MRRQAVDTHAQFGHALQQLAIDPLDDGGFRTDTPAALQIRHHFLAQRPQYLDADMHLRQGLPHMAVRMQGCAVIECALSGKAEQPLQRALEPVRQFDHEQTTLRRKRALRDLPAIILGTDSITCGNAYIGEKYLAEFRRAVGLPDRPDLDAGRFQIKQKI